MKKENYVIKALRFIYSIFLKLCIYIYRFIKYVWYGILWPIILLVTLFSNIFIKFNENKVDKLKKESQKILEKEKKKENKKEKKQKQKQDLSAYKNEDIKFEKKNLGYYINAALAAVIAVPASIKKELII